MAYFFLATLAVARLLVSRNIIIVWIQCFYTTGVSISGQRGARSEGVTQNDSGGAIIKNSKHSSIDLISAPA